MGTAGLLLRLLGELELGEACGHERIVPREALLDVGNVHALAVVLGQRLGESGLQLLGRLLGTDGLLAARMSVDSGEDLGQRNVVALV